LIALGWAAKAAHSFFGGTTEERVGFKVGKRRIDLPGEGKNTRVPGQELTDEEIKSIGPGLKRMLERGEIVSDTLKPGEMDQPINQGSTIVDERIARERLEDAGYSVDAVADRAMVYALHDHALLGRPADHAAKAHGVDADAVAKLANKGKPSAPAQQSKASTSPTSSQTKPKPAA
jgi:hypothetical protein